MLIVLAFIEICKILIYRNFGTWINDINNAKTWPGSSLKQVFCEKF